MRLLARAVAVYGAVVLQAALVPTHGQDTPSVKLARSYRVDELVAYRMQGINEDHTRTVRYAARADGRVKQDASGTFLEEFSWTDLTRDGNAVTLSPASRQFRQDLSLSPAYPLSVPDLSKVQPVLIGPITDLLTFYADVQLAMKQSGLSRAGDHIYIKHGTPNSWADGRHTMFGQDAVDFDITLRDLDAANHTANIVVRHVPPAESHLALPASWMNAPLDGSPNNWAQVQKADDDTYVAQVGRETFDATIKLSLPSGRIVSADLDNPVEVMERDCKDAALSACGQPIRYQIKRQIKVEAEPEKATPHP